MDGWSYHVQWLSKHNVREQLNDLGGKGWELISIINEELEAQEGYMCFFKRKDLRIIK